MFIDIVKVRIPLEVFGFGIKDKNKNYSFTVRLQKSCADGHVSTYTVERSWLNI